MASSTFAAVLDPPSITFITPGYVQWVMKKDILQTIWSYLWEINDHTKQLLKQNPDAIVELSSSMNEEEKELATQLMSDGGQEPSEGDDDGSGFDVGGEYQLRQKVGLVLGPLLFIAIMLAPSPEGLSPAGQAVGASTTWIAIWWMTEPIPIPVTSLLPLVLFPFTGALDTDATAAPYADPIIILLLGGFIIAVSLQRWGLHRRIALRTINAIGTSPRRIILGFMIATAFLSMWISNTATTVMMTPIALAVVFQTRDLVQQSALDIPVEQGEYRFGTGLMLCIAYSASVGGLGTLIGTPATLAFVGAVSEIFNQTISFFQWMLYGVPIVVIGLAVIWIYITRIHMPPRMESIPAGTDVIDNELERLGPISREEKIVLVVFGLTAIAWISRSFVITPFFPNVGDSTIAILGASVLFLIPARDDTGDFTFILDWTTGLGIPWGILLLLGGGLSIAGAFVETGLANWLGGLLSVLGGLSIVIVFFVVIAMTIFLTEITSNTASTAMLMPILASLAVGIGINPLGIMIAGATAASFAFMLPVATPPNAVVFGSGYIKITDMVKAGFGLNLLGIVIVISLALTWLPLVWGIDVTQLPTWAG